MQIRKSQEVIELHVQEVRKRCLLKKRKSEKTSLSDFHTLKEEFFAEIKVANDHDFEDLFYRMQLTYNGVMEVFYIKCFPSKRTGYTLPPE